MTEYDNSNNNNGDDSMRHYVDYNDDDSDALPMLQLHMSSTHDSSCELDVAYHDDDDVDDDNDVHAYMRTQRDTATTTMHRPPHTTTDVSNDAERVATTTTASSFMPPPPPACAACQAACADKTDNNARRDGCAACHAAMARMCATMVYGSAGDDGDAMTNDTACQHDDNDNKCTRPTAAVAQLLLPLSFTTSTSASSTSPLQTMLRDMTSHRLWWVRFFLVPLLRRWQRERTSSLLTAMTASQHVEQSHAYAHAATSASAAAAVTLLTSSYERVLQHTHALDAMLVTLARTFASAILREQQQQQQTTTSSVARGSSSASLSRLPARMQCAAEAMYVYGSMAAATQSFALLCRGAKLLLRLHLYWLAHDVRTMQAATTSTAVSCADNNSNTTSGCSSSRRRRHGATCVSSRTMYARARQHAHALMRCWCVYLARYGATLYDTPSDNNDYNNNNNTSSAHAAAGMHEGRWLFLMLLIAQTHSRIDTYTTTATATGDGERDCTSHDTSLVRSALVYFVARVMAELLSFARDELSGITAHATHNNDNTSSTTTTTRRRASPCVATPAQLTAVTNVLTCRPLYWNALIDQHSMPARLLRYAHNNNNNKNNNDESSDGGVSTMRQLRRVTSDYWNVLLPAYQMLTYVQSPCSLHDAAAWAAVDGVGRGASAAAMAAAAVRGYGSGTSSVAYTASSSSSSLLLHNGGGGGVDVSSNATTAAMMALAAADAHAAAATSLPAAIFARTLDCCVAYTQHRRRRRCGVCGVSDIVDDDHDNDDKAMTRQLHRQLTLLQGDVVYTRDHSMNKYNNNRRKRGRSDNNDSNDDAAMMRLRVYLHTHFLPVYHARCFWLLQPERQHLLSRTLRTLHDALDTHATTFAQHVARLLSTSATEMTTADADNNDKNEKNNNDANSDNNDDNDDNNNDDNDNNDNDNDDAEWQSDDDVDAATQLHTTHTPADNILLPPPPPITTTTTADDDKQRVVLVKQQQQQRWRHDRLVRTCALLRHDAYAMMSLSHSIVVLLERRSTIARSEAAVLCECALPTFARIAAYALHAIEAQQRTGRLRNDNNSNNDDNDDDDVAAAHVCECRVRYSLAALVHVGMLTLPWSLASLYAALVRHDRLCAAFDVVTLHDDVSPPPHTRAMTSSSSAVRVRSLAELCEATRQLDADVASCNNNSSNSSSSSSSRFAITRTTAAAHSSTAIDAFHALLVAGQLPSATLLEQALRRVTAVALPPPLSLLFVVAAQHACTRALCALRAAWDDAHAAENDEHDGGSGSSGNARYVAAFCTAHDVMQLRAMLSTVHRIVFAYTTTTTQQQQQQQDMHSAHRDEHATPLPASLPPPLQELLRLWLAYVHDWLTTVVPHSQHNSSSSSSSSSDDHDALVRLPRSWQHSHTCVDVFGVTRPCTGWRSVRASPVCASHTDMRVAVATALADLALLPLTDTASSSTTTTTTTTDTTTTTTTADTTHGASALPRIVATDVAGATTATTSATTPVTSSSSCALLSVQMALPCAVLEQLLFFLHVDVVLDEGKVRSSSSSDSTNMTRSVQRDVHDNNNDNDNDDDNDVHITDAHARARIAAAASRVRTSFLELSGLLALCRRLEQCIVPGSVGAHTRLAALLRTLFALADAAARDV